MPSGKESQNAHINDRSKILRSIGVIKLSKTIGYPSLNQVSEAWNNKETS